jgi:two-component system, chemotaxis family, protein-glutamate methylesterase/glutaminase
MRRDESGAAVPPDAEARDAHPPGHDLIVIGGSAGSIEAATALIAGLPPDLPAAVCLVVHMYPHSRSHLPAMLRRGGSLPVEAAANGMRLRPGTVYVAVPDKHMLVGRPDDLAPGELGTIRLVHGPRENRARPAVDPLFRSAALAFGSRVIAVVLSGALDDGTAGLWEVRDRGGLAVVQDPADASVASMPTSAIAEVGADHVAAAAELGPLLGRLVRLPAAGEAALVGDASSVAARDRQADERMARLAREVAIVAVDEEAHQRAERYGVPSRFSCPDCGGVLWDTSATGNGARGPLRLRCETGHAFSPATLAEMQTEGVEHALWGALRALEDKAELARMRARGAEARGFGMVARRYTAQLEAAQEHAAAIRTVLRLDGRSEMPPVPRPDTATVGDLEEPGGAVAVRAEAPATSWYDSDRERPARPDR